MVFDKKVAEQTVDFLTQINAIKLNTKNPFTWTSGIKSPIYCDNRLVLSYPRIREFIANSMSQIIKNKYGNDISIVGVATGAIAIGIYLYVVCQSMYQHPILRAPRQEHYDQSS